MSAFMKCIDVNANRRVWTLVPPEERSHARPYSQTDSLTVSQWRMFVERHCNTAGVQHIFRKTTVKKNKTRVPAMEWDDFTEATLQIQTYNKMKITELTDESGLSSNWV